MRLKVCILAGMLLLIAGIMPVTGQVCGDLNGDGSSNISDIVYGVEYVIDRGPAPENYVDVDQCNGFDVVDIAYLLNYMFDGGPAPCTTPGNCTPENRGMVYISLPTGQPQNDELSPGVVYNFHVACMNPDPNYIRMVSAGLTISSPDGLDWGTPQVDYEPDFDYHSYYPMMVGGSDNGNLDTLFFLMAGFAGTHGLPPDAETKIMTFTVGPFSNSDIGKHLVIDTITFGNGGKWRWSNDGVTSYSPGWAGPRTFTIIGTPTTSVSLENVTPSLIDPITSETKIIAETNTTFNIRMANNCNFPITGLNNGFKIYSPDGAEWGGIVGDTIGSVGMGIFDLVFMINYFGNDGIGADSVAFGGANLYESGLVDGFNEVCYAINIGPIDPIYEGKTICLDSCWTPPSGYWVWQTGYESLYPSWGGPYCYEIAVSTNMIASSPTQVNYTVFEGGSSPAPTKIHLYDLMGEGGSYTIGSMDPMFSVDKTSGTFPDDIVLSVNTEGVMDGTYTGNIEITASGLDNSPYSIPINVTIEPVSGTLVSIDRVDGEIYDGYLRTGMPITFTMRFYNKTTYDFTGLSNNFIITSPDGAQWGSSHIDTTGDLGYADFNLVVILNNVETNGISPDTVTSAFVDISAPGLLSGSIRDGVNIILEGIDSAYVGKTICIDSSFLPPSALWSWYSNNQEIAPAWDGPKCYEIIYSADPPPPPPPGDDSLLIPSVVTSSGAAVIDVMTQLSQPIKGATVPLAIPEGVLVDSISRVGLITEGWDYTITDINAESGYLFVALINSFGDTIPMDTSTIFRVYYHFFNASCAEETYITWDTTFMGNPSKQLTFSDITASPIYPGFNAGRDMVTVLPFVKGDVNNDGIVDIEDIVNMIDYMFRDGPICDNFNAMDINGDCYGPDIADIVMLIDYQFRGGEPPECGCLVGKAVAIDYISDRISVYAEQKENQTFLTLNSEIDLKGLEFTLTGTGSAKPVGALEGVELEYGSVGDKLRIGLFDMEGVQLIKSGLYQIIVIDGEYELESAVAADLEFNSLGVRVAKGGVLPDHYELSQNYPNPFNPTTEIMLSLPEKTNLTLNIYNIQGQLVTTLAQGEYEAGVHRFSWSADNYASGVYLYKLISDNYTASKKMLLIK